MEVYTIGVEEQLKVLRHKAAPIEHIDDEVVQLTKNMIDAMQRSKGVGLAGPQVGLLKRLFTVQLGNDAPLIFINPEITATSPEMSVYNEGCLSIPNQYAEVKRSAALQIQAWNNQGHPFTMEADGLLATVIQHEMDHLNGVLFIDYLSPQKRAKILNHFGILPGQYPEAE